MNDNETIHAKLDAIKAAVEEAAKISHTAMWFAALAMCCGVVLVLSKGGWI